jgi:hypothetical protein
MTSAELKQVLADHKLWLADNTKGKRANLTRADLTEANLTRADLAWANLTEANLTEANLTEANLTEADLAEANLAGAGLTRADLAWANLTEADLAEANLTEANLTEANLTRAKGLFDALTYITNEFEATAEGVIVYKFEAKEPMYAPAPAWVFEPGSILTEVVNPCPTVNCACGVNVATRAWCESNYKDKPGKLWRCLIRWPWLAGVVVPYSTDGKIRCARVELAEVV